MDNNLMGHVFALLRRRFTCARSWLGNQADIVCDADVGSIV